MEIKVRDVEEAWEKLPQLVSQMSPEKSRAGDVLVFPTPLTTIYTQPRRRVLHDPSRDANPFFHLFEAMWMLAGSNSSLPLDVFVSDFGKRFAQNDGEVHGAYGYRWHYHNQLEKIVVRLRSNRHDRQCARQMWSEFEFGDLSGDWRDRPCNTHVYFRVRDEKILDMTVCCRSNDAIWGAYGANVVHFSFLQEYVACRAGLGMGLYYQFSNNFHVYKDVYDKIQGQADQRKIWVRMSPYYSPIPLNLDDSSFTAFHRELPDIVERVQHLVSSKQIFNGDHYENTFLRQVISPMLTVWSLHKNNEPILAIAATDKIIDSEWKYACSAWLLRRYVKQKKILEVRHG